MTRFAITFLLLLAACGVYAEDVPTYWQVILSYGPESVELTEATPILPMTKLPRTPGFEGAPIQIAYSMEWLDASGLTLSTTTDYLPLGYRSAPSDDGPCRILMPDQGIIVLRIVGPPAYAAPAALRLSQPQTHRKLGAVTPVPPVFEQSSITLPIQRISLPSARLAGPVGSTKIRNTGPDGNRMVVVVMGDGYTAADLSSGSFTGAASSLVSAFIGRSPWDVAFGVANVYRIDVESNQSGSDNDPFGTFKDTYFNSSFWVAGIERLLAIDGTGQSRAIAAANAYVGAGVWDAIFILVNSTKYGGSGGSIAVSSVHPSANEVILHEYGHTYAGLADEYSDPYPGYPPGDWEPNVDFDFSGPGLKWSIWVEPGTPLPTPAIPTYASTVGAFEGARYQPTGIYRPWLNCLMRSLGVGFCPVCKEAHLQTLFGEVSLTDTASPPPASLVLIGNTPTNFVISPVPLSGLAYQWKLSGTIQAETGANLPLTAERIYTALGSPVGSVSGRVSFSTTLIRKFTVGRTINWAIRADCNGNQQADDIDLNLGILHDANQDGTPDECLAVFCCEGLTGNVDCSLDGNTDISDLSALIDNLYIAFTPLCCASEANVDGEGSVDISDLSRLIDYLYISFTLPAACP
jgi:hypothetical protein